LKNIVQMSNIWRFAQMFTDIFVEMLQKKQITAYRLAKDTGISQGLMGEYKNGVKLPTIINLIKIADYFDVSVDYLLGRTDETKPYPKGKKT
jgi:transcriptional regulator with XRE-family HTH domain